MRTHTSHFELYPLALQHYVAGRMLALQLQTHVAGNILHHAVELFLKAELSPTATIDELKNKYRHNLKKIWVAYKALHSDVPDDFASTIADLDAFEEIRYPSAEKESIGHRYALFKELAALHLMPQSTYSLVLESIDELIAFTISKSRMQQFYFSSVKQLPPFSLHVLFNNNRHHPPLDGA
ncbi:hypothetical protein STPYR_12614 [uncultured Stenotrophomonas sp.]|uniref:HEPN domain-containing protein n=1 Tax=uncultured Stenotrophomonas sp. TaxID=165438 RepID=A0A1Y5Q613_9GAMM|nr:hypothetical protein STPYR_12614 [uncultured Stenotrophomonas sp.]